MIIPGVYIVMNAAAASDVKSIISIVTSFPARARNFFRAVY